MKTLTNSKIISVIHFRELVAAYRKLPELLKWFQKPPVVLNLFSTCIALEIFSASNLDWAPGKNRPMTEKESRNRIRMRLPVNSLVSS